MNAHWTMSLEDIAADPEYITAPKVGLQADDFVGNKGEMAQPLLDRGIGVVLATDYEALSGTTSESMDVPGYVITDPITPGHDGDIVSLVTKWPSKLKIPTGGIVVAAGMNEEQLEAIRTEGYEVFPSMEELAEHLWLKS